MSVINIENVQKAYGAHLVLEDVCLTVPEGSRLALIGHNGAGKTTLMKLILGLTRPTSGRIEVLGVDPASAGKSFRKQLGFLPENVAFHDELTGGDTLRLYARLKGRSPAECPPLLERVGLSSAIDQRVKTYSKGMRQRLGLAQALLGSPRLLLLDEPTTGLDPVLRQEFFQIVRELARAGTTVILSSHILTELEAGTDLAAIMRQGRLVAFGSLDQLRREAGLPTKIHVRGDADTIAQRLNGSFVKSVDAGRGSIEIDCPLADKMTLLRKLADLDEACVDIEIRAPSLDDLYLHYGGRAIAAGRDEEKSS